MEESGELELWRWRYIDQSGKHRTTRYHLTEADARERLRDPVRVEGTRELRRLHGATSDFLKRS